MFAKIGDKFQITLVFVDINQKWEYQSDKELSKSLLDFTLTLNIPIHCFDTLKKMNELLRYFVFLCPSLQPFTSKKLKWQVNLTKLTSGVFFFKKIVKTIKLNPVGNWTHNIDFHCFTRSFLDSIVHDFMRVWQSRTGKEWHIGRIGWESDF